MHRIAFSRFQIDQTPICFAVSAQLADHTAGSFRPFIAASSLGISENSHSVQPKNLVIGVIFVILAAQGSIIQAIFASVVVQSLSIRAKSLGRSVKSLAVQENGSIILAFFDNVGAFCGIIQEKCRKGQALSRNAGAKRVVSGF